MYNPRQEAHKPVFSPPFPTDSVLFSAEPDADLTQCPAVEFPAYTDQHLREFLNHLSGLSAGNPADTLPRLSEPGLYALAVALARSGSEDAGSPVPSDAKNVVPSLLTELRRRNGRGIGADPVGPVRRGRLLQLVGTFTKLATPGTSPRQRHNLVGACPFCAAASSFQVSLPTVSWQCLSCSRSGALLEFAECLLAKVLEDYPGPDTPSTAHTR